MGFILWTCNDCDAADYGDEDKYAKECFHNMQFNIGKLKEFPRKFLYCIV